MIVVSQVVAELFIEEGGRDVLTERRCEGN